MTIELDDVVAVLDSAGFIRTRSTKKVVEYQSRHNGKFLYLRSDIGLPEHVRVVVDPQEDTTSLVALSGVEINAKNELQHGSNMTRFPKKRHTGEKSIHYGRALNIATLASMQRFAEAFHKL